MGLIHIALFATLDLVGQAPGGPDEDPVGFPFGGWQAPLVDEVTGAQIGAAYEGTDALLLGRRTYDIFAAYWPYQESGEDNEIAVLFNSVPKYVASRGRPDLSWAGSTQLGPDLARAVREIRDRHEHVKVVGSLHLVQTLCARGSSTASTSGCTPSYWGSGRGCSTVARCPRTSRSSNRR
jgi:dihydrofolate reductase